MALVQSRLAKVLTHENNPFHSIYIEEIGGARHFRIEIGLFEIVALLRKVENNTESQRPLTHDLTMNVVSAMGGSLREVRITDLKAGTFYAQLVLDTGDGEVLVDARPSDALVLAAAEKCKLLVDDSVYAAAAK